MSNEKSNVEYTLGEDIANSISHGIGFALSISGLVILVVCASLYGDVWRIVSFSIYGFSLMLLYIASTLYHSFRGKRVKYVFRILDHTSIFVLIAGTYTPLLLVNMRNAFGWTIFGIIWGLAITGIVFKSIFVDRYGKIAVCIYLLMGWLCVIAFKQLLLSLTFKGMLWLSMGGLSYTLGIIFYAWDRLPYNHAIWHLFVLGGSILHFFAIYFYVLPVK